MYPKNSNYFLITDKRTIPFNQAGTGTLKTVGTTVLGTGTLFATEMPAGSWVVDLTQDEVRRVTRVDSNTRAYLSQEFTVDLAASTAVDLIPRNNDRAVSISVQIPAGSGDGEIDGQVMPEGTSLTFSKDSRSHSGGRDLVDPIIVDATGTEMQILISI